MNRKTKKLIKGIVFFGTFNISDDWIGGADGLNNVEKHIVSFFGFLPLDLASIIASVTTIIISIILLYCFVSGLFRICTFNMCLPEFEKFEE